MNLPAASPSPTVLCEGWVLKKRRKKMQGFARRYFILYHSGLLAYAFEPGQPLRDQLSLHQAAVSTEPGRKDIHIDSSKATFHIKCLSTDDFNTWMTAFRKFIASGQEGRKSTSARATPRPGNPPFGKSGAVVEEMGSTIADLEESISSIIDELAAMKAQAIPGKKLDKEKYKDHTNNTVFGLFKRQSGASGQNDGSALPDSLTFALQRAQAALIALKTQHAAIFKSTHFFANETIQSTPLPYTPEEPNYLSEPASQLTSSFTRKPKRTSIATTVSDSINEWFDALDDLNDGLEEFVMDVHVSPDADPEVPSRILTNDSRSSLNESDSSSIDTKEIIGSKTPGRAHLPVPATSDEGSLFTILKKNVGKDLSTITFPVTFNEPLTMLQRTAEELEYYSLLDQAALFDSPVDQICYIAAFVVSSYSHTRHRTGRKAFNPMLAETFEMARMKFIAEKVRHNPLEIAYHAEGNGWELHATSNGKTKFWGKSLEIIPLGVSRLKIGDQQYSWKKPSSFMRNLMVGTKYFEHSGKMTIENTVAQVRCVLEFKQNGYWGPSNVVTGTVYGKDGDVVGRLEGQWDDQISRTPDSEHFHILWRMTPFPKDTQDYYGFTAFSTSLNEMTTMLQDKLPKTDSRFRPDVRALENGDLTTAEDEKVRVEELQRERRRAGQERQPRWFKQVGDEWVYVGGYWEARARGWGGEDQSLW